MAFRRTRAWQANAEALARYAALCQEQDIVPIIEPEVIMDGDHTIERCQQITERTLRTTFSQLNMQRVLLEGILLKPNMVLPSLGSDDKPNASEVATAHAYKPCGAACPPPFRASCFCRAANLRSDATARLNAMNSTGEPLPWQISFLVRARPAKRRDGNLERQSRKPRSRANGV